MTRVLDKLKSDHRRARVLMQLLESELIADDAGRSTDFTLAHEIVTYCSDYLNRFHHPLEDQLFERILRRDASFEQQMDRILQEHASLLVDTGLLLYLLDQVLLGEILPRQQLVDSAKRFVSRNREHMQREEETIFNRAAELLRDKDWNDLEDRMTGHEDPLASHEALQQFRLLSQHLGTRGI